jgi:nucleoside-diphosphate-sugar epimerase
MARILVTGATGWVGSVVCPELRARGHELYSLTRRPDGEPDTLRGDLALPNAALAERGVGLGACDPQL